MTNGRKTMQEFIAVVRNSAFYRNFIETLYVCEETPEILWAKFRAPYTKMDEMTLWSETGECDFVLSDAEFAYEETDEGITHEYILVEVEN